jgi:hypothetical protein
LKQWNEFYGEGGSRKKQQLSSLLCEKEDARCEKEDLSEM